MRARHLARASMLPLLLLAGPALATTIAVDLPLAPETIERRDNDPRTVLLRFGQVIDPAEFMELTVADTSSLAIGEDTVTLAFGHPVVASLRDGHQLLLADATPDPEDMMDIGGGAAEPAPPIVGGPPGPARLDIPLPQAPALVGQRDGDPRTVVLSFAEPIDPAAFGDVAGAEIEGITLGYDTALLQFDRPVQASLDGPRNLVVADLPAPRVPLAADRGQLRLDILKAELEARTGDPVAARGALQALDLDTRGDPDVLTALASVEQQLGGWNRAISTYDRILETRAGDEGVIGERDRLERNYGPQVRTDLDWQEVKDQDRQWISRTTARAPVDQNTTVDGAVEARRVIAPNVVQPNGVQTNVATNKVRGEIAIAHDWGNGQETRAALYGQEGSAGIGASHRLRNGETETKVTAYYHKPFWDLVNGITDRGTVDGIELRREQPLWPRWSAAAGVTLSRYGVDGDDDVGRSLGVTAGLRYALVQDKPFVSIGYGFDGLFVTGVEARTNAQGVRYQPLPLSKRQAHSLDIYATDHLPWISDKLRYDAFLGYSVDPYNVNGVFGGLTLAYEATDRLEAGLRAAYSANSGTGTGTVAPVTRIGGYVLWRF
ncbi:MAG: tetratricopeptide repeat protein [Ferrovibrionaceae bacterium]